MAGYMDGKHRMSTENPGGPTEHKPYVPDEVVMPEFTWPAVLVGVVLGIVFGASSLYLVLKVGMTVSASIPVAVLSITLFRWLGNTFGIRKATILENNITQTTGSAGESIAFGVGVTMPALLLIGFEMEWTRVMVVSVLGGLLGILMMIPLRRAFIVKMHGRPGQPGTLLYPEGTACAKVLESGEQGGASGKTVFIGFGFAFFHKIATETFKIFSETLVIPLRLGAGAEDAFSRVAKFTGDLATELLGVGYIIGLRTSAVMMGGAVLGSWVVLPTLAMTTMTGDDRALAFRFIGAGCVAAAGIISMAKTLPMIVTSFRSGLSSMGAGSTKQDGKQKRTESDMPPNVLIGGGLFLLALLTVFLMRDVGAVYAMLGAILVLVFGFLFVTVSSRLTGEIGSSSNPISGMTIATLLLTCIIFLALGMTSPTEAVLALSIGGVVCIAASNGGTTSQDLKTGFLIGATPRLQQWAILIGAITSALVIGVTLLLFASVGTIYSQRSLPSIDLKHRLGEFKQTEEYKGEKFHVWQQIEKEQVPLKENAKETVSVKPGKYLVDAQGKVAYLVDPTITGRVTERDDDPVAIASTVVLTSADRKRIAETFTLRTKNADGSPKSSVYKLWRNVKPPEGADEKKLADLEPYDASLDEGLYLVDADGKVTHTVTARKVPMKFNAPKTQVMGVIINGLLNNKLNWALVMIGACIALMLELCGVPSLAFAVGLYVPMSVSTPIFLGGLVRWAVEGYSARQARAEAAAAAPGDAAAQAEAEVQAIAKSETSPGMLLASGFIAGGSIAGVLYSFLNFLPQEQLEVIDFADRIKHALSAANIPAITVDVVSATLFVALAGVLLATGIGKLFASPPPKT